MSDTDKVLAGSMVGVRKGGGRVLLVSNRLPVTARLEGEEIRLRPSDGGVASGLRHVARQWPVVWFGWYGLARSGTTELRGPTHPWDGATVGIPLDEGEVERYYRGYCNDALWPVLHSVPLTRFPERGDWRSYRAVNERYAYTILRHLGPGDRIWIHDYHLFLVPRLLREHRAALPLAFFLHTPFPEPGEFARVPQHRQLVEGMLGADTVGFHTAEYARNFVQAARSLGYPAHGHDVLVGGRKVRVRVHPMGIDVDSFARLGRDPEVMMEVQKIRSSGVALMLGVDRLDYTKGLLPRLLAFECLLQEHPELHGAVKLLQVAVPSREEIPAYADLRRVVEALVERINAAFQRPDWKPVDYLYSSVDRETLAALYRAADVMVITPTRDGLNLVAKEFVATRVDGDGVLILSKFAGAAAELSQALQVDPNRVNDLARAYQRALAMSRTERRTRMRAMRRAIESNDVFHWAADFIGEAPRLAGSAVRV